jgi:aldehyde dehydrogenase (NAD+)
VPGEDPVEMRGGKLTVTREDAVQSLRGGVLVGDAWLHDTSAGSADHVDPARGKVQASFPLAGVEEVDRAVGSARAAFPEWRAWAPDARREALRRVSGLIRERKDVLGAKMSLENGTPLAQSIAMADRSAEWFDYYAGWAEKIHGEVLSPYPIRGVDYTLAEPVGVVAVIVTWNGPLMAFGMAVAPALAAGCCVVLKPAEITPFSTADFAQICLDAGLPPGVVTLVPGGPEAGDRLVRHPGVDKITFTGGVPTARRIQVAAAESLTPLVLELGGKSANIVFEDADLTQVGRLAARFTSLAGQGCSLPTRLMIHDSVYDHVTADLLDHVGKVTVGDPFDPATTMGPVINAAACERILGVIEQARTTGAGQLLTGGERLGGPLADGYFISPAVFGNVDPQSELAKEEVFGPVLCVMRFSDDEQALEIANGTDYALAAYLHTNDLGRAHRMAAELRAGNVNVNNVGPASVGPGVPFGGIGLSGYGRQGSHHGIREFLRVKNVLIDLGS